MKKIIINIDKDFNIEKLLTIKKVLNNDVDNIYFKIKGDIKEIDFNRCYNAFYYIEQLIEKINSYNFSPLEKIMYVYDIVREKKYKKEKDSKQAYLSNDIGYVTTTDYIVCFGYANIFSFILNKLNINNSIYYLPSLKDKPGHKRNLIYINDEKYDINCNLFFDPTYDSKKERDKHWLYKYKYFGKNITDFIIQDIINEVTDNNITINNISTKYLTSQTFLKILIEVKKVQYLKENLVNLDISFFLNSLKMYINGSDNISDKEWKKLLILLKENNIDKQIEQTKLVKILENTHKNMS